MATSCAPRGGVILTAHPMRGGSLQFAPHPKETTDHGPDPPLALDGISVVCHSFIMLANLPSVERQPVRG